MSPAATSSGANFYTNIVPQIFSERYVLWYQEMVEADLKEIGDTSEFLHFMFDVPDDMNSDSHELEIALPSLIIDRFVPSDLEFYDKL